MASSVQSSPLKASTRVLAFGFFLPVLLTSAHPKTAFMGVILRSPADGGTTKNLIFTGSAEIPRGVYPFDRLRAGSE